MPPRHVVIRLLLLAGVATLTVADDARYNASTCQKSYPCGANVNIHYPFFLADAATAIDGYAALSYCGYPGMAVACDDGGRATLKLRDRDYTVLAINYDNHTVTVADADVLGAGDCPRVTHNVTVPAETWLNLSTTANDNLVFFFDCVFSAAVQRPSTLPPPINCTGFSVRDGESFVAAEPDVRPRDDLQRACEAVVVAPVLKSWLLDDDYFLRLNDDGYGKVLKQGFQLTWDPSAGHCYICEDSGGQCSYSQNGEFLGCLCSDGRVRNPGCVCES
ncbi:hypothetical protein EJB05_58034, partial [Eragrostis curvula]